MTKKWYKWPQGYYKSGLVPWYTIIRRLIFLPFIAVTFVVMYALITLAYGSYDAKDFKDHFV